MELLKEHKKLALALNGCLLPRRAGPAADGLQGAWGDPVPATLRDSGSPTLVRRLV